MKLFTILALAITQLVCAETFKCELVRYKATEYSDEYAYILEAVYLDGVLRGQLHMYEAVSKEPYVGEQPNHPRKIIATVDGITIKETDGFIRQDYGKRSFVENNEKYPYYWYLQTDTFYMPLTKAELQAIRFTDGNGKKCLHVYYN